MKPHNYVKNIFRLACLVLVLVLSGMTAYSQQPSANLDQAHNGTYNNTDDPVEWVNGNVNSQQAHMVEGYSVPYRCVMENLTPGVPIELEIEFDTKHSSAHALDFLTYFDNLEPHFIWGHTSEEIDPLDGYPAVPTTPAYAPIPVPDSGEMINGFMQPQTTFNSLPANLKRMTLFGGTFALVDAVTYTLEQSILGEEIAVASTRVLIKFTPTGSTAILAWGGHIATDETFGEGHAAAGISGSPYHMRLIDWNLNNLGNQDRSLQAAAVLLLPDCNFTWTPQSPVCPNTLVTFTMTNPNPAFVMAWSIINSGTNATAVGVTNDTIFTANSGTNAGSFTVQLIVSVPFAGGSIVDTCSTVITVNVLTLSTTQTNVSCFGGNNGSINLTVSGGTAPYTYVWTGSGGGIVPAGQANLQDPSGLVAGTYNVTVTDAAGCSSSTSATITQPAAALATTETHVNASCFGGSTGSINLSVTGGTPPYSYVWTASNGGVVPAGQANLQDLTGLVAGTYSVVVTDANLCTTQRSVIITQPAAVTTTETHVNVLCFGGNNGSIDLGVSGGTPPVHLCMDGQPRRCGSGRTGQSAGS